MTHAFDASTAVISADARTQGFRVRWLDDRRAGRAATLGPRVREDDNLCGNGAAAYLPSSRGREPANDPPTRKAGPFGTSRSPEAWKRPRGGGPARSAGRPDQSRSEYLGRNVDVTARRLGVRADPVCRLDKLLRDLAVHAGRQSSDWRPEGNSTLWENGSPFGTGHSR